MAMVGILAGVLSAVGGVVSAVGAMQQGKAAQQQAEYNAKVAENNAIMARQQAGAEQSKIARNTRMRIGAQRAAYGASGFTVQGSPLDVLGETAALGKYDELVANYNGEVRARGLQAQAQQYRLEGQAARQAGRIGAASALIGGFGRALSV
jgi:hypothetical protein